jgi:hypothetical protein
VLRDSSEQVNGELISVRHIVTDELRAALLQVGDQRDIAAQPRRLAITSVAPVTLAQWRAAPSFGRSASLPLSTSTNSVISFPVPAVQEALDSLPLR